MMKKMAMMTFLFFGVLTSGAQAQQSINSGGGEAIGTEGSVSYTIGQFDYMCNMGPGGTVSEGMQQFFEISKVLNVNYPSINFEMIVYPNPTTDLVNLKIDNYNSDYLSYSLFDMQGRQIGTNKINRSETQIQMNNLPSAIYLLNVFDSNKTLKIFKIIKKTN
jgi:hypothetical protein